VPVIQFLMLRWLWRLIIWFRFLRDAHASLTLFAFGVGCILSGDAAFRLVYDGVKIESMKTILFSQIVISELYILGPLILFTPMLARVRRTGLRTYGHLVNRYNRAFHDKWAAGPSPEGEPLLGSADIQSLADLGTSFDRIRSMKLFPFTQRLVIQVAVAAALPALPLVLLVIPVAEILKILAGALL